MSITIPSALLNETLDRAAAQSRLSRKPQPVDVVHWLQDNTDNTPLLRLIGGLTREEAAALLHQAFAVAGSTPVFQRAKTQTGPLLRTHLEGKPPIFDDVHRQHRYAYTNEQAAGPLAQRLIKSGMVDPRVVQTIRGTDTIVGLGIGNGRDEFAELEALPGVHVIGVDSSPTAIGLAEERKARLSPELQRRIHFVPTNIQSFVLGGREAVADVLKHRPGRLGYTASSSLHFSPTAELLKTQTGIFQAVDGNGWYAGLHRTDEDPFGRPGILLSNENGERVHIHGEDGLSRKFWNSDKQRQDVEQAGGTIAFLEDFGSSYESGAESARFGFVVATAAEKQ